MQIKIYINTLFNKFTFANNEMTHSPTMIKYAFARGYTDHHPAIRCQGIYIKKTPASLS
jgi:hypothetical protein